VWVEPLDRLVGVRDGAGEEVVHQARAVCALRRFALSLSRFVLPLGWIGV